jgi:hypothetical protein
MSSSRLFTAVPVLFLALFAATGLADEKVTISSGEVVILFDDGTWNYEKRPVQRNKVIKTDRSGFRPSENCNCSGGRNFSGYNLWIDPGKWQNGRYPRVQPPNRPIDPAQ